MNCFLSSEKKGFTKEFFLFSEKKTLINSDIRQPDHSFRKGVFSFSQFNAMPPSSLY